MKPRICAVCGEEFKPRTRSTIQSNVKTCPKCVDSGYKARGKPKVKIQRMCYVCGSVFIANRIDVHRCKECIAEKKRFRWKYHRIWRAKHHLSVCDLEEAIAYGDRTPEEG